MQKAFEKRCAGQKNISKVKLNAGDLVLLRVPHLSNAEQNKIYKFFHIFEGPYIINKQIGENAFELSLPEDMQQIKGVYNRLNL